MILVDHQIRDAVRDGKLGIENFSEDLVQPASYDLRIGNLVYSPSSSHPDQPVNLSENGRAYRIPPYGTALLMTHETLTIPINMIGRFGLQSRYARRGLIASTGPQVDPGYKGKLSVSLLNLTPASHVISYLDPFLSIEFHSLDETPDRPYHGPYQNMKAIGPEILEDLVRLEGVNLAQMQSQFTELTQHVQEWTSLARRFDDFLNEMRRQTAAFEEFARRITDSEQQAPREVRQISQKQAMEEVLELFRTRGRLYYSDIAEALRLDFSTVIQACEALERQGFIEGGSYGKKRTKRVSPKRKSKL
ncbi:dCTP deaminase domain-containing protein [Nitrospira moscoviensis]|uniref:Putative dCTP deaminase n=1 Tax=Nitrospira moscoviensis TaxID=42253 RepID=A0A0K2GHR9_NITMO|nr:hypothetical protein [Nitrospira moscoviensis]ALA60177.1 putative dCTP deaminase [Nitrospira moscoviensis]